MKKKAPHLFESSKAEVLKLWEKDYYVVVWWESYGIIGEPISQMAWDMIAIPAMSSECERVFSSAGRLITPVRNRLKEDVIEASECLSAWYKQESASDS